MAEDKDKVPSSGPGPHNDDQNIATKDATPARDHVVTKDVTTKTETVQQEVKLSPEAAHPTFGKPTQGLGPGEVDVKSAAPLDGRATVLTSAGELDKSAVESTQVVGTGTVHVHTLGPMGEADGKEEKK